MSEKEAWLYLKDAWSKYDEEGWRSRVAPLLDYGLCYAITYLWRRNDISAATGRQMQERLRNNKPASVKVHECGEVSDVYYWEVGSEGAKERAAFCERMAELCP